MHQGSLASHFKCLHLFGLPQHVSCLQVIMCTFIRACCGPLLLNCKNGISICARRSSPGPALTQQAPASSSWHGSGWHAPPPSSAFFLSWSSQSQRGSRLHMKDSPPSVLVQTIVRWQTLNNQPMPTVLVSRFQMQHTLGVVGSPNPAMLSPPGTGSNTRHPPAASLNIPADY